jgi:hypothetical protein
MKNIIQIAVSSAPSGDYPDVVFALTSDSQIYFKATNGNSWTEMPGIPDDENIKF